MEELDKKSKEKLFVEYIVKRSENDSAFKAAFKLADNPDLEYKCWEYLNAWCDLTKERERKIYALVAASLVKNKNNGGLSLGKAIALACGDKTDPGKVRIRRLLACSSVEEVCQVLRPLLGYISSQKAEINYSDLLTDLKYFGDNVRVKWAKDFYGGSDDFINA